MKLAEIDQLVKDYIIPFPRIDMGTFSQDVKVTCDLNNGRDKEFKFRVNVKNAADLKATIVEGLKQKIEEGELDPNGVRDYRIKSDDKQGFFESIAGDIKDLVNI